MLDNFMCKGRGTAKLNAAPDAAILENFSN